MLKIYLDWNVITHIDETNPKLLGLLQDYNNLFVFPYTSAHIRDVVHKSDLNDARLKHDIDLLSAICFKHHLLYEDNKMKPIFCTPKDYINDHGKLMSLVQNTEFISRATYLSLKRLFQKYIKETSSDSFNRIQGSSEKNVMSNINEFVQTYMGADTVEQFLRKNCPAETLKSNEAFFKTLYIVLDFFGFRQEDKRKEFNNIDADATHIFNASFCDYIVTKDGGMSAKGSALYNYFKIQTRAISPQKLEEIILDEIAREYSFKYIFECVNRYGIPRVEQDGNHYTLIRTPVLGLFNACMKIDETWGYHSEFNAAVFCYSFNNTPYLYYTELDRFFNLFKELLPPNNRQDFEEKYISPMMSRDNEITSKARFEIAVSDLDMTIILTCDPNSTVSCPLMYLVFGENTQELISKLENQFRNNPQ